MGPEEKEAGQDFSAEYEVDRCDSEGISFSKFAGNLTIIN